MHETGFGKSLECQVEKLQLASKKGRLRSTRQEVLQQYSSRPSSRFERIEKKSPDDLKG